MYSVATMQQLMHLSTCFSIPKDARISNTLKWREDLEAAPTGRKSKTPDVHLLDSIDLADIHHASHLVHTLGAHVASVKGSKYYQLLPREAIALMAVYIQREVDAQMDILYADSLKLREAHL